MIDFILVLIAGMLSSLSPCSFPLLPGYIAFYMSLGLGAIPSAIACILGLIIFFSIIGVALSMVGAALSPYMPYMPLIAGIAIIIMSFLIVFEVKISLPLGDLKIQRKKDIFGTFIYGMIYGLVSSSCSAPIFLSIVFYAFASGFIYGILAFLIYAIGMGIPIIIATILVSKAKTLIIKKLMKSLRLIQRMSAMVLFIIGVYLIYYSLYG
ncbi:MAG: cytochrome c biogenesis CcdA family protein [Candidatus Methanomethyliaceae archaeon]|nr:cytochrome c biogenesis CcdA family protein [Candidatus Methanomethyliaceae archaeon]MDW7970612.1 cytochrome c biogenesis CcdA family protein [Nitrososphaerota archaeon]